MSIDRDSASASLQEIDAVQRRTKEALVYFRSSSSLIYWGVLLVIGYVLTHFYPLRGNAIWLTIGGAGIAGSVVLHAVRRRASGRRWDLRITYSMLVMIVFGLVWSIGMGHFGGREMAAFWPTLFMFGYVVMGFWLGRFFTYCGLLVTALTIVGYYWLGDWFLLWMAVVSGGGMIAGGLWLRRLG